jgi:hypothetical protein
MISVAAIAAAAIIVSVAVGRKAPVSADAGGAGAAAKLRIPTSIQREHLELHEQLAGATRAGGKTGEAARRVEDLLRPHFQKEEQFALPPLGMLRAFADGEVPANAEEVLALTREFRREYPQMLEEHEMIVAALADLLVAARAERHEEVARFAQDLMHHAESEEQILYPTTVLIGEYLKVVLAKDAPVRGVAPAAAR